MSNVEVDEAEEPSKLRKQLADARTALAAAQAREQQRTIADAGFDPQAGVVGLVAQAYAAQPDADWSVDAFKAFAAQQGLTPPAPAQTTETQLPVAPPAAVTALTEAEQLRLAGQTRLDALGALARPDETPSLRGQIDAAEAKAIESRDPLDWNKAFQLKNQWADEIGERARASQT